MRLGLRWLAAGLLFAATAAGAAPPSTPTRTQTWTPKATATATVPPATATATTTPPPTTTGTLLPSARIPPELIQWVTPAPTPVASPRCVYVLRSDVELPECVPVDMVGGGSGATPTPCIDEQVPTFLSGPRIWTTGLLPAGSLVDECIAQTAVAVNGGYTIGLNGADDLWGAVSGTVGSSNLTDVTMANPVRITLDEVVTLSSTHATGLFQDNTGRIDVRCRCRKADLP